jgi:hypothetical protein
MKITRSSDKDFMFSDDGDLIFDKKRGDLKIVNHKDNLSLTSQIFKRIQSRFEDWEIGGIVATRFSSVIGASVNQDVLNFIEEDISLALVSGGLLSFNDFVLKAYTEDMVNVIVGLQVKSSDPKIDKPIRIIFSYDTRMNQIVPRFIDIRDLQDGNIYNS